MGDEGNLGNLAEVNVMCLEEAVAKILRPVCTTLANDTAACEHVSLEASNMFSHLTVEHVSLLNLNAVGRAPMQ